jgi:hypothetical protein
MASTRILSPKPLEMAPAPSLELSQLDQLCSGNLDTLLDDACRIASRKGSFSKPQASPASSAGKPAAKASAAKTQVHSSAAAWHAGTGISFSDSSSSTAAAAATLVGMLVVIYCLYPAIGSQQTACFALVVVLFVSVCFHV